MPALIEDEKIEIKRRANNIIKLMDDPQEGLSTWWMFLIENVKYFYELYLRGSNKDIKDDPVCSVCGSRLFCEKCARLDE